MYGCDLVVSTSINEGFGLGFLEPWLFGKAVVGRDLPQVTSDFRKKGLSFPSLYQTLKIEGEDFSTLDDSKKLNIIEKASKNPTVAKSILDENQLNDFLTSPTPELIEANAQKILTEYSVESYGQNLKQIYATSF
jgi:glycosyltransferase involved in cell wall biosynthesis